jgi:hypothetical protein
MSAAAAIQLGAWQQAQHRALEEHYEDCQARGDELTPVYHGTAARFADSIREQGLVAGNRSGTVCVLDNPFAAVDYAARWAAFFVEEGGDEPGAIVVRFLVPANLLAPFFPTLSLAELHERTRLGTAEPSCSNFYMLKSIGPNAIEGVYDFTVGKLKDEAARREFLYPTCTYHQAMARKAGVGWRDQVICNRCGFSWAFGAWGGYVDAAGEWRCADCMPDEPRARFLAWRREIERHLERNELANVRSARTGRAKLTDLDRALIDEIEAMEKSGWATNP